MDSQPVGDYTPCILASEGFENINVGALFDVQKLLGLDGGIVLDTRVIAHACLSAHNWCERNCHHPRGRDICSTVHPPRRLPAKQKLLLGVHLSVLK